MIWAWPPALEAQLPVVQIRQLGFPQDAELQREELLQEHGDAA
jgi:hypothetical protein